jgi:hypothetical protein
MVGTVYSVRTRALQWALVWAVALAVVGMHHISAHDQSTHTMAGVECCEHADPGMAGQHTPEPGGRHDMVHLCLAVLCVVLGLGLILLALRRRTIADLVGLFVAKATRPRSPPPPPRGVPARLASLCVLRL